MRPPDNERRPREGGAARTSTRTSPKSLTQVADESRFCSTCGSVMLRRLGECFHEGHQPPTEVLIRTGARARWVRLDALLEGVA
jgi:hypothetical protein